MTMAPSASKKKRPGAYFYRRTRFDGLYTSAPGTHSHLGSRCGHSFEAVRRI